MFLNISNHSIKGWSHDQKKAALELAPEAELVDVPFPNVIPRWPLDEVISRARELTRALDLEKTQAAMVAGESIMCVLLVRELQALGVVCYSATTERVVEESEGEKRSRFTFVRFREWPAL